MPAKSILSALVFTSILATVACGSSNEDAADIGAAEGNIERSSIPGNGDYRLKDNVNVAYLSISGKTESSFDFQLLGRGFEGDLKALGQIEVANTALADRPGHYFITDETSKCSFVFAFSSGTIGVSVSGDSCALDGFAGDYAKDDGDTAPAVAAGKYDQDELNHLVVLGVDGLGRLNFQLQLTLPNGTVGVLGDPPLDPTGEFEKADYDKSKRVWQYKGLTFKYDSSNDQYSFTIGGEIQSPSLLNYLDPNGTYKASSLWD